MSILGMSIGAHYRVLKSKNDIEKLLKYFQAAKIEIVELSFYDKDTYDLFFNTYSNLPLDKFQNQKINLHLPKRDWSLIGVERIVNDACSLDERLSIDKFIIHLDEYKKYKDNLVELNCKISVENPHFPLNYFSFGDIERWTCDINNFYYKGKFQNKKFVNFLKTENKKITEFHFAHDNHDKFNLNNINDFEIIYREIEKIINLENVIFIFEGTDKLATSVRSLIKSLDLNIKLIKKIL